MKNNSKANINAIKINNEIVNDSLTIASKFNITLTKIFVSAILDFASVNH